MDYADKMLLTRGPWNLDGMEDLSNWEGDGNTFIRHITPKGLAIEMHRGDFYWHTSIYKAGGRNIPYWLSGRLPEEYKQTRYFPDADPFDDVVCLD